MRKYLLFGLILGTISCTGTKSETDKTREENSDNIQAVIPDIQGQWIIENVVENDSSYVRPSEIEDGVTAYINFNDDQSFGVVTNCNHLGGQYIQSNDSIRLTDILTTEMACDNMDLEEMLKKILPEVNYIDCINDSITRLNATNSESYIVLKKSDMTLK